MEKPRKWRRRLAIGGIALLLIGAAAGAVALGLMFPSRDTLDWPEVPPPEQRYANQSAQVAKRLLDELDSLRFAGDPGAALAALQPYKYLRQSPYLPADRRAAQRAFSVAVGEVLLDEDLARVAHASSVYEGRYALYLPAGDAVTFEAPTGTLSFGAVGIPDHNDLRACPVTLAIEQGGRVERLGRFAEGGSPFAWRPFEVPLIGGEVTVRALREPGCAAPGHLFLSDPTVWTRRADAPPVNVLYVNVCTWRSDDLGQRGVTPVLDALAADSHQFSQARANANWSKASQISALTGRYPSSVGIKHFRVPVSELERQSYDNAQWPTMASVLRGAGYETAALVDNIFLADYLRVGVDLGFARFVDNARHIHNTIDLVGDAVDWLGAHGDRPFFLYLNLANPHFRYRPPREYLAQIGLGWADLTGDLQHALHLGEVAYTDDAIGALLRTVENLGLAERTLVVLHGDHGETVESIRDLAVKVPAAHQPRTSMVYGTTRYKHGWSWQETELRVPLFFARPGAIERQVDVRPVGPIDVAPTVLAHLGLPRPTLWHGRDVFAEGPTAPILVEGKQFDAVIDGPLKYVRFWPGYGWWKRKATGAVSDTPELLYDLRADPLELTDLAPSRPADVARLRAALDALQPQPDPLHFMRFSGPPGHRIVGRVDGARRPRLTGHGPTDTLDASAGVVRFAISLGAEPVTLAFVPEGTPAVTLAGAPDVVLGPHALPLIAPVAGTYHAAPDLLAIGGDQWPSPAQTAAPRAHWWSQRLAGGGPEPWRLRSLEADVMDAMREWGYAQ